MSTIAEDNKLNMNNSGKLVLTEDDYIELTRRICLEKYNINHIRELVFTIFTLTKLDHNNRKVTIRLVKNKSCNKIFQKIKYIDDIYDIIARLVKMDNDYKTERNHKLTNYDYLKI